MALGDYRVQLLNKAKGVIHEDTWLEELDVMEQAGGIEIEVVP